MDKYELKIYETQKLILYKSCDRMESIGTKKKKNIYYKMHGDDMNMRELKERS